MISEREAYVYIQLPGTLETVPAALLRVQTLPDGTQIGRFRYGDRYLQRPGAVSVDPFHLPLAKQVFELQDHFTEIGSVVHQSAREDCIALLRIFIASHSRTTLPIMFGA